MRNVVLDLKPFGKVELRVYGGVISEGTERRGVAYAEVLNTPFVPIVSASSAHARAFGQALIETADALDRAIEGLTPPADPEDRERFR